MEDFDFNKIQIQKELKIVFMGTPEFSAPVLEGLLENYKVRAVVTQPDKLVGREQKVQYSPIKKVALDHTILVLQPEHIKDAYEEIQNMNPDLIVTCAYGQIIPKSILDIPRLGCINVHASLLPRLRGGAPIHRAIMNGHKKTGITIMYMSQGMDDGDIISQREVEISETETASSLHDKLMVVGKELLLETLPSILDGTCNRVKQDSSQATYGYVIKREDERLDFSHTTRQIYNQVRGLNSWPGAYCILNGKIIKVWECQPMERYFPEKFNGEITAIYPEGIGVKVSNGEIVLTCVQPEGKKRMSGVDFANGYANNGTLVGKVFE